jgi:tape measure domain-containing protein
MSDNLSYVVQVLDKASAPLKTIQKNFAALQNQIEGKLSKSLLGLNAQFSFLQKDISSSLIRQNKNIAQSFDEIARSIKKIPQPSLNPLPNPSPNPAQPNRRPNNNGGAGGGFGFKDVARATGYYKVVNAAYEMPGELLRTRRETDSLNASLQAILPQYDKTKTAEKLAAEEMDYLANTAYRLGVSFDQAKQGYVSFLAASAGKKDSLQDVRRQFEAFSSLSRIYGINPYRFGLVINAMSQMKSKGKIMLEELQNQLGESLPGAVKLFSDSLGISETELRKLLSTSGISANVLKAVANSILNDKTKMEGLAKASNTLDAKINRLTTSWSLFKQELTEGNFSEVVSAGVTTLDYAVKALTYSISGLGDAWADAANKINRKLHPEIGMKEDFDAAKNFNDYMGIKNDVGISLPSTTAGQTMSIKPIDINVTFTNAPAGTTAQVSRPNAGANIGFSTNYGREAMAQ